MAAEVSEIDAFVAPAPRLDRRITASTAASIGVHVALLLGVLWLSPLKSLVVPPPQPMAVEIVTQQQFDSLATPQPEAQPELTAPTAAGETSPAAPVPPSAGPPTAPSSTILGVHIANQFYAGGILNAPGNKKLKQTLETFAPGERLVQLCNIEGLEQIKRQERQYDPDVIVSYAMSDPVTTGTTLAAQGAAFRSRRKWYRLSFKCTVADDLSGVTAYEFETGRAIPRADWEAHDLNESDEIAGDND